MHDVVRKNCMDYLVSQKLKILTGIWLIVYIMLTLMLPLQTKNADYFSSYVTEDFTTYINRKRKNNCHGNHIEMQAMAEMYNRPVEVYQSGVGQLAFINVCENVCIL